MRQAINISSGSWLVLLLVVLLSPSAAWASARAASVTFSYGKVAVKAADGTRRGIARGDTVYSGETVITEAGRAQLRFTDGAFVSLVPNTEFAIENYRFEGRQDGSERSFFSLLRGGLRTLTGLIGHRNRDSYRLRTPVATIGIRGTLFSAAIDSLGRLLVSVGYDPERISAVLIENGAGSLLVQEGQNAVVDSSDSPPQYTTEQGSIGPEGPSGTIVEQPVVNQGDAEAGQGAGVVVLRNLVADSISSEPFPVNYAFATNVGAIGAIYNPGASVGMTLGAVTSSISASELATIDLEAMLETTDPEALAEVVRLVAGVADPMSGDPNFLTDLAQFLAHPATIAGAGSNDSVFWGAWTNGRILYIDDSDGYNSYVDEYTGNEGEAWVYGPVADNPPMGQAVTARYVIDGGSPSYSYGGLSAPGAGVRPGGTLDVDFGNYAVEANFSVDHHGLYTAQVMGDLNSNGTFSSLNSSYSSSCTPNCSADVDGFLSGHGSPPPGAGMWYQIVAPGDDIEGVAGLHYTGPAPGRIGSPP